LPDEHRLRGADQRKEKQMKVRIMCDGKDCQESGTTRFDAETIRVGSIIVVDGFMAQVEAHYPGDRQFDIGIRISPVRVDLAVGILLSTVQKLRGEVKDLRGEVDQLKAAAPAEAVA
jgi:hypothetical protein